MASYRTANIRAQGERIGYGGAALPEERYLIATRATELSTSAFGDRVVRRTAA
jgi:hypothetical protein